MRKGFGFKVWGSISLLLAALFWIWSSPDFRASKKIPINFWTGFTGPDGEQMVGLIREFHRLNPDVEVSLQRIDWGVYYNKLFVAGLGKRGPEVFVLHAGMLPRFASAGLMGEMDELLDTQSRAALDDLVPVIRPKLQWEGHQVAWPLDVHMMGLYCNLDLFRQAGWVDSSGNPRVPRNREEFLATAAAIRRLSRPGKEIWGFGIADPNLT
ncbi:MAG: extracellular solute-binding protein, partial [Betaproteobacteria bacterium]|nr:extracellular solute-binding protein [Betaproteobacteria bacterium]